MKKLAYLFTAFAGILVISLTGCKDDSTPPSITIIGDAHVLTPKGSPYYDAGATASDDKDESVYVMNDISTSNPKNPDTDVANDYTITYTAQDRAGNTATATRTVSVTYTNWQLNHNYNVTDICLTDTNLNTSYTSSVLVDTNYTYRTHFSNLRNFFTGYTYMDPSGRHITVPKQKPDGILSQFTIEGSGTISDSAGVIYRMDINYTFKDTTGAQPDQNRHATFISF